MVAPFSSVPVGNARQVVMRSLLCLAALIMLSGCFPVMNESVRERRTTVSSSAARNYYEKLEVRLVEKGLLKTNGGADAGFDAASLAGNFERIALYDEFQMRGQRLIRTNQATHIRRWEHLVGVSIVFGDSVPDELRKRDTEFILDYLDHLEGIIGQRIEVTDENPNFHIFVLNAQEIYNFRSRRPIAGTPSFDLISDQISKMTVDTYCSVFTVTDQVTDHRYVAAVAVIKSEHPDLLRQACYHEEIAQGLGLTNDSRDARPSIFNDDDEYALLTFHDELLLRMLYSPEVRSGMTRSEAMPVINRLARDLRPGQSI